MLVCLSGPGMAGAWLSRQLSDKHSSQHFQLLWICCCTTAPKCLPGRSCSKSLVFDSVHAQLEPLSHNRSHLLGGLPAQWHLDIRVEVQLLAHELHSLYGVDGAATRGYPISSWPMGRRSPGRTPGARLPSMSTSHTTNPGGIINIYFAFIGADGNALNIQGAIANQAVTT